MVDPRWNGRECCRSGSRTATKFGDGSSQGLSVDPPASIPATNRQQWASCWSHYSEDNTQPHTATADYKSQDRISKRIPRPNVHGDVISAGLTTKWKTIPTPRDFWNETLLSLAECTTRRKRRPWSATVEVSLPPPAYDARPLIGHADRGSLLADGSNGNL